MGCGIEGYMGLNPDWKGSLEAMAIDVADDEAGGGGGSGTGVDEPPPPLPPRLVREAISLLASFRTSDKLVLVFPVSAALLLLLLVLLFCCCC